MLFQWEGILKMVHLLLFFFFPHMKSKSFLSTFIRYSFSAVFFLWITYLLADMHINKIPWFSLQEWFMIAGEFLVYFAFILAMKDTKKTQSELFFEAMSDWMKSFAESIEEYRNDPVNIQWHHESCKKHDERYTSPSSPVQMKKTTKGIPLSAEHRAKISESLKKKNAEKKAQAERIQKTATASQKRKAAKK